MGGKGEGTGNGVPPCPPPHYYRSPEWSAEVRAVSYESLPQQVMRREAITAAVAVLSGRICIILRLFCEIFLKLQYWFC